MQERFDIQPMARADFDEILRRHGEFWDHPRTLALHHPVFIHELGNTAYVARQQEAVAGYLLGVFAQTAPVAYVHMVAVHPDHRRLGLGRRLYGHFAKVARAHGAERMKATASPDNGASLAFHGALGFVQQGVPYRPDARVRVVRDYLRPGEDRVVMVRDLSDLD